MAQNQRKPMAAQESARRVHRSRAYREERRRAEDFGGDTSIRVPSTLKGKEMRSMFESTARELDAMGLWHTIDSDQLERYVTSETLYRTLTRKYMEAVSAGDDVAADAYERRQDRAFKQAQAAANALGLNVTSRCRIAPTVRVQAEKLEL